MPEGAHTAPSGRAQPLSLADFINLSFQFHSVVYVSLTQRCPIRCRHCFVESGPDRVESIPEDAFESFLAEVCADPGTGAVLFSGGEPFSHPLALKRGLAVCDAAGVHAVVGTSGYFGRSLAHARRFLQRYPGIGFLWLSTDVFHEEFVDLPTLRCAIQAAQSLGIPCGLQIAESDPENSEFIARLLQAVEDILPRENWYLTPLSAIGRANEEATKELAEAKTADSGGNADLFCPWLGAPWLHEDGELVACPNTAAHKTRAAGLRLGTIGRISWAEATASADGDPFIQTMRTLGPTGIFGAFPDMAPPAGSGQSICDQCLHVACNEEWLKRIRRAGSEPDMAARLRALRLMLYGEMPGA